jgi:hypothetical protein
MTQSNGASKTTEYPKTSITFAHYIIPIPVTGIPPKVMRLFADLQKILGEDAVHMRVYTAPDDFQAARGVSRTVTMRTIRLYRTNMWVEIKSGKSLEERDKTSWPI